MSDFELTMSQMHWLHTLLCAHGEALAIALQQPVPAGRNRAAPVGTAA